MALPLQSYSHSCTWSDAISYSCSATMTDSGGCDWGPFMKLVYTSANYEGVNDSGTKDVLPVKRVFSWHLLGHSSTDLLSKALPPETLLSWDKFMKIRAAGLLTPPLMRFLNPLANQLLWTSGSCQQERWPCNWTASQPPRILKQ